MMNKNFLFFFGRSIAQRRGRIAIAALSVTLAVSIVTGLAGITYGIRGKLGGALRSYGANLIVTPETGDFISFDTLSVISGIDGVISASGHIFGRITINDSTLELIGLDTKKLKEMGWKLQGHVPAESGEILAGTNLKKALDLDIGLPVTLSSEAISTSASLVINAATRAKGQTDGMAESRRIMQFTISGFIEKGGPEDSAFILPLPQAWELLGRPQLLSAILVRGRTAKLDAISERIRSTVRGIQIKTLRQVAVAEQSLLEKIQILLLLVTAVVLFAAIVSIMSSMGANVIERREEIGLMKALGATRNNIRAFYFAEALLTGVAGGIAGYVIGYIFTQAVSWGAFGSFIHIPIYFMLISVVSGLLLSVAASHFPVWDALTYNPAVILREE